MRIVGKWARFQISMYGDLRDSTTFPQAPTMDELKTTLTLLKQYGMKCLFDPIHEYGRIPNFETFYPLNASAGAVMGDYKNFPPAALADVWVKLINWLEANDLLDVIYAFDIMNEPHDLYAGSDSDPIALAKNVGYWIDYVQQVITAIRAVNTTIPISVEGYHWASAAGWEANSDDLHTLYDPSGLDIIFQGHLYFDRDASGTNYYGNTEILVGDQLNPVLDANGNTILIYDPLSGKQVIKGGTLDTNIGVYRLQSFLAWLKKYNKIGIIGEMGVGWYDSPVDHHDTFWGPALYKLLLVMQENHIPSFYFGAGPQFLTYGYTAERQSSGMDARPMAVLCHFTGVDDGPTTYYFDCPTRGTPLTPATLGLNVNAIISTPFTITFSDNGAGGTFNPTSVEVTAGFNFYTTFTYTPPETQQVIFISGTNNGGLTDPTTTQYPFSTVDDFFTRLTYDPNSVLWPTLIYTPYTGKALELWDDTTQSTLDVPFKEHKLYAPIDTSAVTSFKTDGAPTVKCWYDQSPNNRAGGPVTRSNMNGKNGAQLNSVTTDYPTLNTGYTYNNTPINTITFNRNRMDMPWSNHGLTGLTLFFAGQETNGGTLVYAATQCMTDAISYVDNNQQLSGSQNSYTSYTTKDLTYGYADTINGTPYNVDANLNVYAVTFTSGDGWITYKNGIQVSKTSSLHRQISMLWSPPLGLGYYPYAWNIGKGLQADMLGYITLNESLTPTQIVDGTNTLLDSVGLPPVRPELNLDPITFTKPVGAVIVGTDFDEGQQVTSDIVSLYTDSGINTVVLTTHWETLADSVTAALNPTAVSNYLNAAKMFTDAGLSVILSPLFNMGRFENEDGSINILGDTILTSAVFASFWTKFVTIVKTFGDSGIVGYNLMGKPHDLAGSSDDSTWVSAAQAAINTIRTLDTTSTVYVEGVNWGYPQDWTVHNPTLHTLTDPVGKLVFGTNFFPDANGLGTTRYWSDVTAQGGTLQSALTRLGDFTTWLNTHTLQGAIMSTSVGDQDDISSTWYSNQWQQVLRSILVEASASNLSLFLWGDLLSEGTTYTFSPRYPTNHALSVISIAVGHATAVKSYDWSTTSASVFTNDGSVGCLSADIDLEGLLSEDTTFMLTFSGDHITTQTKKIVAKPTINFHDHVSFGLPYQMPTGSKFQLAITNNIGMTDPAPLTFSAGTLGAPLVPSIAVDNTTTPGTLVVSITPDLTRIWPASYKVYGSADGTQTLPLMGSVTAASDLTQSTVTYSITLTTDQQKNPYYIQVSAVNNEGLEGPLCSLYTVNPVTSTSTT